METSAFDSNYGCLHMHAETE